MQGIAEQKSLQSQSEIHSQEVAGAGLAGVHVLDILDKHMACQCNAILSGSAQSDELHRTGSDATDALYGQVGCNDLHERLQILGRIVSGAQWPNGATSAMLLVACPEHVVG